jgi:predicted SnoaL-like aldol condensation-catalyzing enzyme
VSEIFLKPHIEEEQLNLQAFRIPKGENLNILSHCPSKLKGVKDMNKQLVYNFIDAINEHNVDKICSLMTDDHKFIDSQGNEAAGKEQMRAGWIGYFQLFPDYKIEVTDIFINDDIVAAFGFAGGTLKGLKEYKENYWRLPASWKAIIKNDKIQLWQVYADSKIPYDIMVRARK